MSMSDIFDGSLTNIADVLKKRKRSMRFARIIRRGRGRGGVANPSIRLSSSFLAEGSSEDTFIGTLSVSGVVGTPTFTLVDSSSNKAKQTGDNILAGSSAVDYETTSSFNIIVSVSGVIPAIGDTTFSINVTNVVEETAGEPIGLLLALTKAA